MCHLPLGPILLVIRLTPRHVDARLFLDPHAL